MLAGSGTADTELIAIVSRPLPEFVILNVKELMLPLIALRKLALIIPPVPVSSPYDLEFTNPVT
jgi:hypothetical protein